MSPNQENPVNPSPAPGGHPQNTPPQPYQPQPNHLYRPAAYGPQSPQPQTVSPQDWFANDRAVTDPAYTTGYLQQPKSRKKKVFIITGLTVLLAALSGGAVFGLYLPNTPDNVWNTAISRTGKALDSLVTGSTDTKKLQTLKTSELGGSVKATMKDGSYAGDFTTKFDQTHSDSGLNVSLKDQNAPDEKKLSLKMLSEVPDKSVYPNIFLQFTGIKSLGLDAYFPQLAEFDGSWISIDSEYLKATGADYFSADTSKDTTEQAEQSLTSADIAEVARTEAGITKERLFTTDKNKAVFTKQSFAGKETVDGVKAYHYKVKLDKTHTKDYCVALRNSFFSSSAYRKITNSDQSKIDDEKKKTDTYCQDEIDKDSTISDTFDMWIDSSYKLVYKVRAYEKDDKNTYADIGQNYKGGDDLSLFVAYHEGKTQTDDSFTLKTNLKTSTAEGVLTFKSTQKDNPYDVHVTLKAKASNDPVTITPPTKSTPVQDMLKTLGIDPEALKTPQAL